jgi:hypothetical protein
VLSSIRHKIQNDRFQFRHVKGHAEKSSRPWDIYTTINILVDNLANTAIDLWEEQTQIHDKYDILEGEEWQLYIGQDKVYKDIDKNIRECASIPKIKDTWNKNGRINQNWFHEVNWTAMEKAMRLSNNSIKHWVIKRSAWDCGAHAILLRRKERDNDHCPFCGQSETVEHVYQCQDDRVQTVWIEQIQAFELYLKDSGTDPEITSQIIEGLQAWRNSTEVSDKPMIWDQSQIGWRGILEGALGLHWMEQQQYYSISHPTKAMNAKKWAHLTIRKLWIIAWELWKNRNAEAHRHDQESLLAQLQNQIDTEIELGPQG